MVIVLNNIHRKSRQLSRIVDLDKLTKIAVVVDF